MGPMPIDDESVIATVRDWLKASGPLLIELYYPHSGGGGTYYLVASFTQFSEMVSAADSGAVFSILQQRQYPIRGIVDNTLIEKALAEIRDGEWYRIVEPQFYPTELPSCGIGDTHLELKEDLEECRGKMVWMGKEPNFPNEYWVENEADDSIVAFKL